MIRRLILSATLSAIALTAADKAEKFGITLQQPAVVQGTEFKAGDVSVSITDGKATIKQGKVSVEVPVKVEANKDKYFTTRISYKDDRKITEISVGGTNKHILLQDNAAAGQ